MLELGFGIHSFNKYIEDLLDASAWLCMKVNGRFLNGGKHMYTEQHKAFNICDLWHVAWAQGSEASKIKMTCCKKSLRSHA